MTLRRKLRPQRVKN